jgi:hypothetical protein
MAADTVSAASRRVPDWLAAASSEKMRLAWGREVAPRVNREEPWRGWEPCTQARQQAH